MNARRAFAMLVIGIGMGCSSTAGVDGQGVLTGRVAIGPICPVEQEGVPCPVPPETYAGVDVLVRRESDARLTARVDLDDAGRYRVELRAGRYLVTLDHDLGIERGAAPTHRVEIMAGGTAIVDFEIDTGIR